MRGGVVATVNPSQRFVLPPSIVLIAYLRGSPISWVHHVAAVSQAVQDLIHFVAVGSSYNR